MSEETTSKKQRTRSPAYPSISLKEALPKASIIWNKALRHYVGVDDCVKFWGLDPNSGVGHSALSALKKYGLLEEQGRTNTREVKLTEFAIKLIFNPDTQSPEYRDGLKKAALSPVINADLWERFGNP